VPETVVTKVIPTIFQKIILSQPEKNLSSRGKKANKQDNLTQALFDYVVEQSKVSIASTSETSETSNLSELVINKLPESIEPISKVMDMPPKEISDECDFSKPINEVSSAILLSRT